MRALITGVTGQDGSYLAEYLDMLGYDVWGLIQSRQAESHEAVKRRFSFLHTISGDLLDYDWVAAAVRESNPDEVYNLAAVTNVLDSFKGPKYTFEVNGLGAQHVFEAAQNEGKKGIKVYQASSSELFGNIHREVQRPLTETDPLAPVSPYGIAKLYAHLMADNYRKRGLWVACGIAFNHESERRDPCFVTRKITLGLARCMLGLQTAIPLGNLNAKRDWGYAPDYIKAMHRMLQRPEPENFVLATGRATSIYEWLDMVARSLQVKWEPYVVSDPSLYRPMDIAHLIGDAAKAQVVLNWKPEVSVEEMVTRMCFHDLAQATAETTQEEPYAITR